MSTASTSALIVAGEAGPQGGNDRCAVPMSAPRMQLSGIGAMRTILRDMIAERPSSSAAVSTAVFVRFDQKRCQRLRANNGRARMLKARELARVDYGGVRIGVTNLAIPDYQTAMLPLLRLAADGREHRFRDAVEQLAVEFKLTDEERAQLLPSGAQPLFDNRVGWARTYLKQAGLLSSSKRGVFQITDDGLALLAEHPEAIDVPLLHRYAAFQDFLSRRREKGDSIDLKEIFAPTQVGARPSEQTPEDALAAAYQKLRRDTEQELLDTVKAASPAFFERVVIDLLVAMGYGGSRQDAGRAIGRSGDEGIDGIIKEDKLGLDAIYVQAKRWDATVGRPEIQKFAGALQGQRATKGVFITTSQFSRDAEEYTSVIASKIILIDGEHLARLMVDHNVGVTPVGVYELKRIDSDYFEGE